MSLPCIKTYRIRNLVFGSLGLILGSVFVWIAHPITVIEKVAAVPMAQNELESKTIRYTIPGDKVFPEGVAYDRRTGNFYVGSFADGTIYRGNIKEPDKTSPFLPGGVDGRTKAQGLKVDNQGKLWVSGGKTGKMWIYDTGDGHLIASFDSGVQPTQINDVTLAPDGSAYFTDSLSPYLYRVAPDSKGVLQLERWIDFTGTPFAYQSGTGIQGINANGIEASRDGRYLLVVQTNAGKIFRIETATKTVSEVDLSGFSVAGGDGLWLDGQTLYISLNSKRLIVGTRLARDFSKGKVLGSFTDPSFTFISTIAKDGNRLLVVNSQLDKLLAQQPPELPFTLSNVRIPNELLDKDRE
jgi:sugar lactone lactonase YvrE